jgi:hypothetical protein
MTPDEIEARARELYEMARQDGEAQIPWEEAPEFMRETWRALAARDAGAAVD